ncbi:MAG TPA: trigger factor [Candidatus Moranbacteria bacterium]|nr:trigger factor [Candidatus Moranbacteria bacterium]HAT74811.1 trigger factor [Candidatus Moranbacteria bacterium]
MIKKLPNSRIEIDLTVEWKEWRKYIASAVAEISAEFKIPGFRPGKAPRNIIEQRVGKEMILNNAADRAISKKYADFIIKEKIAVLGHPKVEIEKINENEDFIFRAIVAVMPEAKINDSYKKEIKKINEEYKNKTAEAGEEEINLELEKIANSRVKLVTVRRAAGNNDSAEIDFEVSIDGKPIENGTSKKHLLTIGKGVFIPGFEENLIGMSEGEEKEFRLPFPVGYFKKDLAGKTADFKVKVNLVQERQTPEINDELASSLGKFKDLAELKKNIKEGLEHENAHKLKEEKNGRHLDEIARNLEVEVPEILVQDEKEKMFIEFEQQIQSVGMAADDYLIKIKKTKNDLMEEWAPQAEKRVKSAMALREIAKMEEIKLDSKEIEEEMNKTLQYYKNVKDFEKNIGMERLYNYTKGVMENERVFEMLENL